MTPTLVAMITFPHSSWFSSTGIPRQATRHTPRFSAPTQFGVLLRRKRSEGSNGSMNLTKLWCQMTPVRPRGSGYHGIPSYVQVFPVWWIAIIWWIFLLTHWEQAENHARIGMGLHTFHCRKCVPLGQARWQRVRFADFAGRFVFWAMNQYMGVVSG